SFSVVPTTTNAIAASASSTLNNVSDLDITTFTKATDALKTVDSALSFINGERAKLGALQSRFETSIANLQVTSENLSASRSRILDADFAAETANLSRSQILQQAGTAMVAQANQLPQGVLALLR
ncbi:MAG: flagellin, partial [Burkholderiaceae bacterium]|nr:flagellin [Burkholderiaceae bacterium]